MIPMSKLLTRFLRFNLKRSFQFFLISYFKILMLKCLRIYLGQNPQDLARETLEIHAFYIIYSISNR